MNKIKAQICFAANADLLKVEEQLKVIKSKNEYEFYCCFLPRHIVERKGFTIDIVDILENTLGDNLTWMLKDYNTFEDCIVNLPDVRIKTANLVDKMFILDSRIAEGVRKEIALFTNGKVILLP